MYTWGNFIKSRPGGLLGTRAKTANENPIPLAELERLEIIRKLKQECKVKKFSRTAIAVEDMSFRKW